MAIGDNTTRLGIPFEELSEADFEGFFPGYGDPLPDYGPFLIGASEGGSSWRVNFDLLSMEHTGSVFVYMVARDFFLGEDEHP
jgi:hypothetical protein